MRHLGFVLFALSACGQLAPAPDAASDAGSDAQLTCSSGKFQTPIAITELNTPADERGIRFRANETVAVFSRGDETDSGLVGPSTVIMEASRASVGSSFSTPTMIFQNPYAVEPGCCDPTLSEDGRLLFVETWWASAFGPDGNWSPLMVVRQAASGDAGAFASEGVGLGGNWSGPYGVGWNDGDGFATADGVSYYWLSVPSDAGPPVVYETSWSPVTFNEPMAEVALTGGTIVLASPDMSTSYDDPVVTLDALTMYLAIRNTTSTPRIALAARPSPDGTFGAPTPLAELDYGDDQYPTWISADGCRLYLTRRVAGQYDLYVANRSE